MMETTLDEFKEKRKKWLECLKGKDRHSIVRQLYSLVWDAAVYHIIDQSREYAKRTTDNDYELNGMIHRWINNCFGINQIMAIRRLLDTSMDKGKNEVVSLLRLIKEMEESNKLFTRENIFDAEDLEYNLAVDPSSRWRHEQVDIFSSVKAGERSPTDVISIQSFTALKKELEGVSKDIITYSNKFLAHSASSKSRIYVNADKLKITFQHLPDALEKICKVANFVSIYILGDAKHRFLRNSDGFDYIDRPLVPSDKISSLMAVWEGFKDNIQSCENWGMEGFSAAKGFEETKPGSSI